MKKYAIKYSPDTQVQDNKTLTTVSKVHHVYTCVSTALICTSCEWILLKSMSSLVGQTTPTVCFMILLNVAGTTQHEDSTHLQAMRSEQKQNYQAN